MAGNAPRKWKRSIRRKQDSSYRPGETPYIDSYPPRITNVLDPNHDDIDNQYSLLQISTPAKEEEWKASNRNTGGASIFLERGDVNPSSSPTVYSDDSVILFKNNLAPASRNVKCRQCGSQLVPSKVQEVPVNNDQGYGYQCINNCDNNNTKNDPHGARRRKAR